MNTTNNNPAIIINGTHSGSGKTTITLGIMAALKRRNLRVQPFKCGPDFIDPTLHKFVTEKISRNLDLWMMGEAFCKNSFSTNTKNVDISVIEGVMGMFDGDLGSGYALGKTLNIPSILVIDASCMAQSAAAIVKGFEVMSAGAIKGVIVNRIASERHLDLVKESIEKHCDAEFLGYLPRSLYFTIPSRHLGLHLAEDEPISREDLNTLSNTTETHIDLDRILDIAEQTAVQTSTSSPQNRSSKNKPRIAVARDKAFCFYYQDNFDLIEQAGAELVFFSPLSDTSLPEDIQGLYLGGGYPELYAQILSENKEMLHSVSSYIDSGLPTYAECGGFMYLTTGIYDEEFFPLVDIFPTKAQMKKTRASLGYREVTLKDQTILGKPGEQCRGHEFHYSTIEEMGESARNVYSVDRGGAGYLYKNCLASYIHLHFGSNPLIAENFVQDCSQYNGKEE